MPARSETLPHNPEAERVVLGSCLLSFKALEDVAEILNANDFYDINNRKLWEIISGLYNSAKPIDLVSVIDEMKRQGEYDHLGGQAYIAELIENVNFTGAVSYHAGIVHDYALRRRLIEASNKIAELAYKCDTETQDVITQTEQVIFEAVENKSISHPLSMKELTMPALKTISDAYHEGAKKFTGYSSGFEELDKIISGFQPGSLNIIAARPSMGKTSLAMNIAQFGQNGEANPYILVFSLEMTAQQLMHRMYAAQARVNVSSMHKGTITEEEFYRLTEAAESLSQRHIFISDSSELTAIDFRTQCRRFKARHPELALVIVDYIQLMHSGNKRTDNRQNEVAEISRSMKAVALELGCPIIALSQLSRETEKRNDKKPQLWDLRDSGAIEQDADTVILLYRESYYGDNENNELVDDTADLRIAKNRNGGTGTCKLVFQREYTRFVGLAEEY